MKAVCIADVHIHPYRICSKDGGHDRLLDGLSVLRQSLDLARELSAIWIMAGDFKQPKPFWPQEALTGSHAILRDYPDVQKIMLAGNHDAEGIGGSGLAPFKDCATVVERTCVLTPEEDVEILFAPWNADLEELRRIQANSRPMPLVAHGFIAGCMLGPEDTRIAEGIPLAEFGEFPYAIFGDIHKSQYRVPMDAAKKQRAEWKQMAQGEAPVPLAGKVFYCGSPYQQNWGERNDGAKGALVVDSEQGIAYLSPLSAPRYIHLELDEKGLSKFAKNSMKEYAGDFVRIIYTGKPTDTLDVIREVGPATFRSFQLILRREERTEARAEIHAGMDRPTMIRNYMAAHPVPDGIDSERTYDALVRLTQEG
jgi:hypothetical protein